MGHRSETSPHDPRTVRLTRKVEFCRSQGLIRCDDIEVVSHALRGLSRRQPMNEDMIEALLAAHAKGRANVALTIGIDEQYSTSGLGNTCRKINGRRRFARASLVVEHCDSSLQPGRRDLNS